jgi:DNA-binding response OmpR family regulator
MVRRVVEAGLDAAEFQIHHAHSVVEVFSDLRRAAIDALVFQSDPEASHSWLDALHLQAAMPCCVISIGTQPMLNLRHLLIQGVHFHLDVTQAPAQLAPRVRALLNRQATLAAKTSSPHASFKLDERVKAVRCGSREVTLTATEFNLLQVLFAACGSVVSLAAITHRLGGAVTGADPRWLEQRVYRLRRRLVSNGLHGLQIRMLRGVGYQLQIAGAAS